MDFAKGLLQAYETRWSYINTFKVQIQFAPAIKSFIEWKDDVDGRDINLNIVSIDTPQFTNQNIEVYVGDQWRIHNGRDELYRFSMTFRDQDQMKLYKKFVTAYQFQKSQYLEDCKSYITLWKDADYMDEVDKKLFDFEEVMIDSVSQLQFNNTTEAQIAEFTVQFKTPTPLVDINFGSKSFRQ